jgi:NAD(P)-dependent dehydrogenase (short-subunit alcohol dehydrogenase family)
MSWDFPAISARPRRPKNWYGVIRIEILVNNLGIFEPKPFEEILDSEWMRFLEVNVLSGVRLARLPAMSANWRRIIFISSESALQIPAEMSLRRHQNGRDCRRARVCRGRRRHHRQQCSARPTQSRDRLTI